MVDGGGCGTPEHTRHTRAPSRRGLAGHSGMDDRSSTCGLPRSVTQGRLQPLSVGACAPDPADPCELSGFPWCKSEHRGARGLLCALGLLQLQV